MRGRKLWFIHCALLTKTQKSLFDIPESVLKLESPPLDNEIMKKLGNECVCVCETHTQYMSPQGPVKVWFCCWRGEKLQSGVTASTPPFEWSGLVQADKHFQRLAFHFFLFFGLVLSSS